MSKTDKTLHKAPPHSFWVMFFASFFIICISFVWLRRGEPSKQPTYMDQINKMRSEMNMEHLTHNSLMDDVAKYIHLNYEEFYENYFVVLDYMDTLGLADNGQYPYVYLFSLDSTIADQINSLPEFEQGVLLTPDAISWGHYTNEELREYVLVLLLRNPQFEEMERLLSEGANLDER